MHKRAGRGFSGLKVKATLIVQKPSIHLTITINSQLLNRSRVKYNTNAYKHLVSRLTDSYSLDRYRYAR